MQSARVALVTASSGGIGRGIAQALADAGFVLVISGRDDDRGHAAADEIGRQGTAQFIAAEALDQRQVESLVDRTVEIHGRLDVLVNVAGGSSGFAAVHELSDEAFEQALTWNVKTTFWATRRALPHMIAAGFGRIVNISSVQGKQVNKPNASHYVTAKHALNGFTKAVAFEYGHVGITCNALCVGAVETEMMRTAGARAAAAANMTYEAYVQRYADLTMLGRLNTAFEVGAMTALLTSEAGGGITGAILNVDAGTCSY